MTLTHSELLQLKRWNTPSVFNGWEQISKHDRRTGFNLEETKDFMPHMGVMVGYAVTVVCEPSNPDHQTRNPNAQVEYREYIASIPGPKIVVVQDLDKPYAYGSYWGEVGANMHRSLGCVGTITDGAIRDLDEMNNAGFKAIASKMCIGHAYSWPVRWNCEVEVFGTTIKPGQLIHADKHGFLVIPEEDQAGLLDATRFMDKNECDTVITSGRNTAGIEMNALLQGMKEAGNQFGAAAQAQFGRKGEW
ncbi:RraA family protein [Paenibacillus sp. WQ 127069]|uniref:Putative 4-hydroxy-4-methyl-2-oxoglutarate aldolase n=1 Tax=Paenibacillus baimaensis TaxID=2982185 RepID=A0ABT2UJM9_9BACL|nr:RraA family protein [Paenibacillus sp. WQ 127069]MCU6794331.1 RraA family protein [Paenibacillus sp. WQ 127069]